MSAARGRHCRRHDDHPAHSYRMGSAHFCCAGGPATGGNVVRRPYVPASEHPTDRQVEVLAYIDQFVRAFGYPPTVREIGAHFGIRSTNGVHGFLRALEAKGMIERKHGSSRAIRVTEAGKVAARPQSERGAA